MSLTSENLQNHNWIVFYNFASHMQTHFCSYQEEASPETQELIPKAQIKESTTNIVIITLDDTSQVAWDNAPHWGKKAKKNKTRRLFFPVFLRFLPFSPKCGAWSQVTSQVTLSSKSRLVPLETKSHAKHLTYNILYKREFSGWLLDCYFQRPPVCFYCITNLQIVYLTLQSI